MKMLPFTEQIIRVIGEKTNMPVIFRHITPEAGGSINESFKVETSIGFYFVKRNDKTLYPGMFEKEAKGLELLRSVGCVKIPEVIATGEHDNWQFLILKFAEKGIAKNDFWEDFGRSIATLHKNTQPNFGLDYDNYIGSLKQKNTPTKKWVDFFIHHRLEPQIAHALNQKKLNHAHFDLFNLLFKRIENFYPDEFPALLHGDLWTGNFMSNSDGHPLIFDPAVYYGHREMDIAMTQLFGGFHSRFYNAYNESFPLKDGWKERVKISNLYPLLVHLNLFGGSYIIEVESVLNHFK